MPKRRIVIHEWGWRLPQREPGAPVLLADDFCPKMIHQTRGAGGSHKHTPVLQSTFLLPGLANLLECLVAFGNDARIAGKVALSTHPPIVAACERRPGCSEKLRSSSGCRRDPLGPGGDTGRDQAPFGSAARDPALLSCHPLRTAELGGTLWSIKCSTCQGGRGRNRIPDLWLHSLTR